MPELEKVKCSTPDFAKENAKKLLALFPECEGQKGEVDIDKLRQVLSSTAIEGNVERYQFTWPGKRAAMAAASAATTKTLRPCAAESVGRDGTPGGFDSENLYIEGDNLEVLKLLQTSYAGKVKMIYIDPPYNTGHDFVYRDRFSLTQKELDDNAGAFDEDGNRFEVNDSAEARYHTNWCSMMYPRLKLAKALLRDNGFIFVSIGDEEFSNMKKLLDEVFGEVNYRNTIATRRYDKNLNRQFMDEGLSTLNVGYEFIFVYSKSPDSKLRPVFREADAERSTEGYWKGFWNAADRPTMRYEILGVQPDEGQWKWQESVAREAVENYNVYKRDFSATMTIEEYWRSTGESKRFLRREKDGKGKNRGVEHWVAPTDEILRTSNWTDMLASKPCGLPFDSPKNPDVILELAYLAGVNNEDMVIDFFSGSSTTAQSVMQLNAEDDGNRKFIMVQLPEVIDPEKLSGDAKKTAQAAVELLDSIGKPHVICEIAKERIRRAGKKIAEENATTAPNLDIGFRVLKLDTSSLRDTSATVSETNQEFANFERIKSDRSPEDLLFQVLLETRIPLSEPIVKRKVAGNEVLFVGYDGEDDAATSGAPLAACLDAKAKMTTDFFIEIAKLKPGIAFFRDDAFVDDSARTNLQQVFAQFSPTTSIKVI
jgi:adenine-specific DNA-methyltransferase